MFFEDCLRTFITALKELPNFNGDGGSGFLAVVTALDEFAAQENLALWIAKGSQTQFVTHSKAGNHGPRDLRSTLEIVRRAVRHAIKRHFLRSAPAKQPHNLDLELGLRRQR